MVETPEDEATQDEQEEGEETIEETEESSFLDDEAIQDEQEGEETVEAADSSSLDDEAIQDEQEGEETVEAAEGSSLDDEAIQDEQEGEETVEAAEGSSLDDEAIQDEQEGEETVEAAEGSSLDDEAIQDEQEGEETVEAAEGSSLLASFGADLEFLHGDNMSFYQANKAYYEDQNYEEAIAEFQAAIEYEKAHPSDSPDSEDQAEPIPSDEVIAKSMYWIGESYIKLNQQDQAVETFRQLTNRYKQHYLTPAARRRIASLRLDEESESA